MGKSAFDGLSVRFDYERAKLAAEDRGLTQEEWMLRANVTKPTMLKFLSGDERIKLRTVEAIANAVGLRAADLVVIVPEERVVAAKKALRRTPPVGASK